MARAEFSGHCQACGRLQKAPTKFLLGKPIEVLAKHGYTVRYGWFSGVCRGSGFQAFEVSHDQVSRYIAEARAEVSRLEAEIAQLLLPATENRAWVHNFEGGRDYRTTYVWRQVEIIETVVAGYPHYTYRAPGTRGQTDAIKRIEGYSVDYAKTVLEVVTQLNAKRAAALRRDVARIEEYIVWQEARVASWAPAPLLPVTAKDKQGFDAESK